MEISNKNRTVKVGVVSLIVLALFLILFIFYTVGTYQELFSPTETYYIFLPNVQGLEPGALVTIAGMKAGVVGYLKIVQRKGEPGIVTQLKIKDKYADLIKKTSFASIKTMGVLGNKYVDISLGRATDTTLVPNSFVATRSSINLEDIARQASQAVEQLNTIARDVMNGKGTLGMLLRDQKMGDDLRSVISEVKYITNRISQGEGNAGRFLQDTAMFHNFNQTFYNMNEISSKIRRGEGMFGRLISDTTLYGKLLAISARTDALLSRLETTRGTAGELVNNKELYQNLLNVTNSLNELVEDIKKNPKKYMHISVF